MFYCQTRSGNHPIARLLCKRLAKNLQAELPRKGELLRSEMCAPKVTKRVESEVEKARSPKALDRAEAAELKKENARITAHKKLWKQLHKELEAYLKARPALANLLK